MNKANEITREKILAKLRAELGDINKRKKKERYELYKRVTEERIETRYRTTSEADKRRIKSILERYNTGRVVTNAY